MEPSTPTTPAAGPPEVHPDLSGRRIDDFQVLRKLGAGGMGQVYLAQQISLKRNVALKVLRPDLAADANAVQRFRREAEAVARLTHANIVQVYATGVHDGIPYIALEFVEGRNLREYLSRKGPPDTLLALSIMRQVAAALQRASELGIVHRDVKPENILLTRQGEVKVADFGLSRCLDAVAVPVHLTQSGVTMGTPLYMSPEQVQGQPIDPRSDIYSFGVTAYHMLAGQPPYQGNNAFDVALKHVTGTPKPLQQIRTDVPPELCAIVAKMMAKDPAQRFQTSRDLLRELVRLREAIGNRQPGLQTQILSLESLPGMPSAPGLANGSQPKSLVPTEALPARPLKPLWPWLMPLSLFLTALGGCVLAWLVRQAEAAPTQAVPFPGDLSAVEQPETLAAKEQRLRINADQFAHPKDPNQVVIGRGHFVELGLFYLEQWRLAEADKVFTRLEQLGQETKSYLALGRLGHAIVLALGNAPGESNRLFHEVITGGRVPLEGFEIWGFLNQNPQLRLWIGMALDYNLSNDSKHPFSPEQLNALRPDRPTRLLLPPGRPLVPPGDKPPKPMS